jgi:AbrB family looped-hinge helix DNA binding protein
MQLIATITSKRQLTIPVAVFKLLDLSDNSKVVVEVLDEGFLVKPASSLLDELGGSVTVSEELQGVSAETAIAEAKKKHFKQKK